MLRERQRKIRRANKGRK
jgi:hypothetical protein